MLPLQLSCKLLLELARQTGSGLLLPLAHVPLDLPQLLVFILQLPAKRGRHSSPLIPSSLTRLNPAQTAELLDVLLQTRDWMEQCCGRCGCLCLRMPACAL